MKAKKTFLTILLAIMAVFVFATWQYRLLSVLVIVMMWKSKIKAMPLMLKYKCGYKVLVGLLLLCIWIAIPNYYQRGRTQLVYLDKTGRPMSVPTDVYLLNVLFPEEELANFGIKASAFLPSFNLRFAGIRLSSRFVKEAQKDFWTMRAVDFYTPYNRLSLSGSNPGTFTIAQAGNDFFGTHRNAIYITKPKHYDASKTYPVVFFAHGFLGSWELYNGLFDRLDDCFVVSIGTRGLSGIFSYDDIQKCFSQYIPYLESRGCNVNHDSVHLIGLSNGGSAADVALRSFSKKFASVTYLSTGCNVIKRTKTKVLLVGGGKDESSAGLPGAKRRLVNRGTDAHLLWYEDEGHYVVVHKIKEIIKVLKDSIICSDVK